MRDLKFATTLITKRNGPMMCDVIQPQVCIGTIVAFKCFFLNFLALLQKMNPIDLLADGSPPNNLSLSLIPFAATPPQDTELVLHAGSLDAAGSSG